MKLIHYYFFKQILYKTFYFEKKGKEKDMDKDKRNKNKEGDNYMDKTIIIIGFNSYICF